ncbi:hypothetical protein [Halorussus lipolyticus]|uniref:hypothetical protein n=1 Tax=Halorussus lipolyticus TaxID=3034024 RepID=UPI0023E79D03|nr:hypothetical protein [Halorussus sp. DT80]
MRRLESVLAILAVVTVVCSGVTAGVLVGGAPGEEGPAGPSGPEATGETATTAATWWDADWQYKRPITVTEESATDLHDYPVVTPTIDIGSASPSSIRVVDESTGEVLDFGVSESGGGYRIAVQLAVGAGQTRSDLAVYYGNPDASSVASPWNQVRYNFYDDFDDGTLHPNWVVESGDWTESGGTLKPSGDGVRIHRNLTQPLVQSDMPIRWETRVVSRSTGGGSDQRRAWLLNDEGEGNRLFFLRTYQNSDDGVGVNIGWNSPDSQKLLTAGQFSVGDYITEEVLVRPNGDLDAFAENEANGETGSKVYATDETYRYSQVAMRDHGGNPGAEWDYIRIRYDVDSEPSVTVGDERTNAPATTTTTATPTATPTTTATTTTTQRTTTTTATTQGTTTTTTTTTTQVCQPSAEEPSMQAVQLHTQETRISADDPGHISGAIASDITNNCPVKVQITLQLPNGVRVGGGQNIQSGGGGLTTSTFVVQPGEVREISADVYSDDPGKKTVQASITYFPVGHRDMAREEDGLTLEFDVAGGSDSKALADDSTTAAAGGGTGEATTAASDDSETTERPDSDGDGVPDDVDYAPDDPSVQSKSDLQDDGVGIPGFSVISALAGLALAGLLLATRNGRDS